MQIRAALAALGTSLIVFASNVLAGGGLVSFEVKSTNGSPLPPGEAYIVTPTVHTDNSYSTFCKDCPIKIKFENPQDSDVVNATSDKTDENGQIEAKVVSYVSGNRVMYAEVTLPTGEVYISSRYILNYTSALSVPQEPLIALPVPSVIPMTGELDLKVVGQSEVPSAKGPARYVNLEWNQIVGAERYEVYLRPSDYESWATPLDGVTQNTYSSVLLSANYNYYVKVSACNLSECVDSKEVFVSKVAPNKIEGVYKEGQQGEPLLGDKKVEELEKKVADLESKVAEGEKKQNFLEAQLENIMNFLKSIFPFWK